MEKILFEYIQQHHMINTRELVIAGVSGGADSMCMLALLLKYREITEFELVVVHVNHGIRGKEADRDETHVKNFCEAHKVSFCVVHIDVPTLAREQQMSLEEAGRKARREAFEKIANDYMSKNSNRINSYKIALAHHKRDVAETVLFNLVRGSGVRGAAAMIPVNGNYIRPLLCVTREQIVEWLAKEGIEYVEDSTNQDLEYTRNRMRNVVLPYLEENVNAGAVHNLFNFASMMEETYQYIENQARIGMEKCAIKHGSIWKLTEDFKQVEKVLKGIMVQQILFDMLDSHKDITAVQVRTVIELFDAYSGTTRNLMGGLECKRGYTGVYIYPAGTDIYSEMDIREAELGKLPLDCESRVHYEIMPWNENIKNQLNHYTKYFDYDKIEGNLCIRKRRVGDYLILSKDGGKKTLKSYLIDQKVPRDLRDRLTVVADGSHILWVVGLRDSAGCFVTNESNQVVKVWLDTEEH